MEIEEFKMRRIHYPNTPKEDDYFAMRLNGKTYRTEDIDMIIKEVSKFLNKEER